MAGVDLLDWLSAAPHESATELEPLRIAVVRVKRQFLNPP
jgi:hypothetical protein